MISPPQSVEQLLNAARELGPGDRRAFLVRACRDSPELRRLVDERLLAEENGGGATLDGTKPDSATNSGPPPSESNPTQVHRFAPGQIIAARFTVVRYITRGGMGEGYRS